MTPCGGPDDDYAYLRPQQDRQPVPFPGNGQKGVPAGQTVDDYIWVPSSPIRLIIVIYQVETSKRAASRRLGTSTLALGQELTLRSSASGGERLANGRTVRSGRSIAPRPECAGHSCKRPLSSTLWITGEFSVINAHSLVGSDGSDAPLPLRQFRNRRILDRSASAQSSPWTPHSNYCRDFVTSHHRANVARNPTSHV